MSSFRAVVEGGLLRPLEAVTLTEGDRVQVVLIEETNSGAVAASETQPPIAAVASTSDEGDPLLDDFLAAIRFDGPADLAENFDDYRFGRKTWP